jgi:hypothetical protein
MDLKGAHITVHGDIIENHGIVTKTYKNGVLESVYQHPAAQHAQKAEEAEEVQEAKPIPVFFRTNAQSITKIEQKWQEALEHTTKTGVIRFVKSHDSSTGYFKLAGYTNEQLAEAFNEAQDKFVFTANDFENANKPLKK